jgi:N-methylhydantoinase B/oxoprolinase/acetone carboxylase alpha subunit
MYAQLRDSTESSRQIKILNPTSYLINRSRIHLIFPNAIKGCLEPIQVIIPQGSLLWPSEEAAVVGGNVLTSQRLVDLILKIFKICSASQGCMNNITFGSDRCGYYETVAGGCGAGPNWHGRHGVHTHMTNTRITGTNHKPGQHISGNPVNKQLG